jgi:hypothetical protein
MYEGASKIFRTNAVKIIKATIRPIGLHYPRSSSLPHVDTGPTVFSIFGTLPGSPFLTECQAPSAIRPGSHHIGSGCKELTAPWCFLLRVFPLLFLRMLCSDMDWCSSRNEIVWGWQPPHVVSQPMFQLVTSVSAGSSHSLLCTPPPMTCPDILRGPPPCCGQRVTDFWG